ncbi:unnamed protein product [Arabidopsis arenosa]|uniref:Metallo-beta-lactamase domain-containing protein n=1 Tax=Arabidopsis arenosa TaxID=38785 RepID=A0A8S1ZJN6_ARAAE|nr:unnamed protein product [Arabidopsis arenosa]
MGSSSSFSSSSKLLFRQLFEKESSTFTYLLADVSHQLWYLIDPVDKTVDRDLQLIDELGLKLIYAMNTHVHADHVTGTGLLKTKLPGVKSVCVTYVTGEEADQPNQEWLLPGMLYSSVVVGGLTFRVEALINSTSLYIHRQIFTLPEDTLIYPAHDYKGFEVSTVGEEMQHNPRLTKDKETFKTIMSNLNLSYPKMIDVAVPANMVCGLQDVPSQAN